MKFLLLFGFLFSSFGISQDDYIRKEEIPDHIEVNSDFKSYDESIEKVYANTIDDSLNDEILESSNELNKIELDAIEKFINDDSVLNTEKELVAARYGIEEQRVVKLFSKAKKKKFKRVELVIDINRAININYELWPMEKVSKVKKNGEKYTVIKPKNEFIGDIDQAFKKGLISWKNNEMARIVLELMEKHGFELNPKTKSKYAIYSPGIYYAKDRIIPIMHLKELFLISKKKIKYFEASFNWTIGDRVNRLIAYKSEAKIKKISRSNLNRSSYSLAHLRACMNLFSDNKEYHHIKDVFKIERPRFIFRDGSFQEIMYNLGRYNQNDRMMDLMQKFSKKLAKLSLKDFVSSYTRAARELPQLLFNNPKFKISGLVDTKFFGWLRGYGALHTLLGYGAIRPEWTPDIIPDLENTKKMRKQIDLNIFSKLREGATHDVIDAYPKDNYLLHTKVRFVEYLGNLSKRVDLFFGSMNLSNNYRNIDKQSWVSIPDKTKSKFFKIEEKILKFFNTKLKGDIISPEVAVFKNTLCYFLGLGYDQVTNKLANEFYNDLKNKDLDSFFSRLRSMVDTPRDHMRGPERSSSELVELRIKTLEEIKDIYKTKQINKWHKIGTKYWIPYIMLSMSHPKLNVYEIKTFISLAFYKSSREVRPDILEEYSKVIWDKIQPVLKEKLYYFERLNMSSRGKFYKTRYTLEDISKYPPWYMAGELKKRTLPGCEINLTAR